MARMLGGWCSSRVFTLRSRGLRCTPLITRGMASWGQTSIRPYWRCYYPNTQAIIYVVDSSDTERLSIAQEEFHATLQEEELKDAIILIYAYKQDLPGALDAAVVTEALNLHVTKNRQWSIFKTSAIKGDGLFEGLDWYDFVPLIRLNAPESSSLVPLHRLLQKRRRKQCPRIAMLGKLRAMSGKMLLGEDSRLKLGVME
ncbi:hypothetical protein M758_2G082100 [Ceratodon purpureus]|nr:hypothetical protein M758_2G082100 [Ceratodon purpureus]